MRVQIALLAALLWSLAIGLVACDDGGGDGDGDADTDVDSDTDSDSDSDTGPTWTTEVVDGSDVGQFASLDVDSAGNVGVAYYGYNSRVGDVCDVSGGDPVDETWYPVYYASRAAGSPTWSVEQVTELLHNKIPEGLSFRFSPSNVPSLGLFGGETVDMLCSANDSVFATKTAAAWTFETAATDSSAPIPEGDDCPPEAAVKGYTVGSWPALAFNKAGAPAIMYRDTHFGQMQRDDLQRADAEVALGGGGFRTMTVDCGDGGGRDNAALFDSEDRFVGFQRITTESNVTARHGLWAHRLETDGTWHLFMLATGQVGFGEDSVVAGEDGTLAVAYYDYTLGHPFVAELEDPTLFSDGAGWVQEDIGDNRWNEGLYPSIARHPDGRLAVAYRRCNQSGSSGDACEDDYDALVFAWRNAAGAWTREVVDEGSRGACGTDVSLGFGPDGTAWIAYTCVFNPSGSEFVHQFKVARRRPL